MGRLVCLQEGGNLFSIRYRKLLEETTIDWEAQNEQSLAHRNSKVNLGNDRLANWCAHCKRHQHRNMEESTVMESLLARKMMCRNERASNMAETKSSSSLINAAIACFVSANFESSLPLLQESSKEEQEHTQRTNHPTSAIKSKSRKSCEICTEKLSLPPALPIRRDSLNIDEQNELRNAAWFQEGIPREIALEILSRESVGSFLVRRSTSKPGCFALSLRIPRESGTTQSKGIANYLILETHRGFKIKGFTKEFPSLTSLIVHHSVMPELLPCPLLLNKYSERKNQKSREFVDIASASFSCSEGKNQQLHFGGHFA